MISPSVLAEAQYFLEQRQLAGWLIHDYRHSNPVFSQLAGNIQHITRPCFLFIPTVGEPRFLAHHVDAGRLHTTGLATVIYRDRPSMMDAIKGVADRGEPIAMEYSPLGEIPRASRVDAGTLELVRSLGLEVVSSADLLQFATQRWTEGQLESHKQAATSLGEIVLEAFQYVGQNLRYGITEYGVAQFIRTRFDEDGMTAADGPIVATNAHASDPHHDPPPTGSSTITKGDWLLIDLWAKEKSEYSIYGDITWVAYVGAEVPPRHQQVFDVVVGARDAALTFVQECWESDRLPQGWEVDAMARAHIESSGYGEYFTHRLGHSLGLEVHGEAVNLDGFETHDTRTLLPGIGFTIEPGIYLPEFGMRSEINIFMSDEGPVVTSPIQREVIFITSP